MRLKIQDWIENDCLSEDAYMLFNEAIICYKVGAYRAAYIMSYLGFEVEIKYRIVNLGIIPTNLNSNEWEAKKNLLNDSQKWEDALFTTICTLAPAQGSGKSDKRIFMFSKPTEMKIHWEHYRLVRNECVHFKEHDIDSAVVEELWNFIIKKSPQFYVNGGEEHLATIIVKSFSVLESEKRDSYDNEIEQLNLLLDATELSLFLSKIENEYEKLGNRRIEDNYKLFFKTLTVSNHNTIEEGLFKYLSDQRIINKLELLYSINKDYINSRLVNDINYKRSVWKEYMETIKHYINDNWVIFEIYSNANVLSKAEQNVFFEELLKVDGIGWHLNENISSQIIGLLYDKKFFEILATKIDGIDYTDWDTANKNEQLLFAGIKYCEINKKKYDYVAFLLKRRRGGTTMYDGITDVLGESKVKSKFTEYERNSNVQDISEHMEW